MTTGTEIDYNQMLIEQCVKSNIRVINYNDISNIVIVENDDFFPILKGNLMENDILCTYHIRTLFLKIESKVIVKELLEHFVKLLEDNNKISQMPKFIGISYLEKGHQLLILYEYVEGTLLKDIINNESSLLWGDDNLPTKLSINISKELINAISNIHSVNIFHQDIRPSNIVITKDNLVRLINFKYKEISNNIICNVTSVKFNAALYQAPDLFQYKDNYIDEDEQKENKKSTLLKVKKEDSNSKLIEDIVIDTKEHKNKESKVDIWAIGVILSELYSKEKPWSNANCKNFIKLEYMLTSKKPFIIPNFFVENKIYSHIEYLIRKCTEINPDDRPSINELVKLINKEN